MRKIKELEERIIKLEGQLFDMTGKYFSMANDFIQQQKKLDKQEEFLKETVAPFIANSLKEDLDKGLTSVIDILTDLIDDKPEKKEAIKTKTTKAKKESK